MKARLKFLSYWVACSLVQRLPERLVDGFAVAIAGMAFGLTPKRRKVVEQNLSHVVGKRADPTRIRGFAAAVYRSVARYYVDLLRSPTFDVQTLRKNRVREIGYQHLEEALADGRGVILATAHYGCPEMALQAARAWGLTFLVLTEAIEPPELSALFSRLRASHNHRFAVAGVSGLKQSIRTLRDGGAVLLAVDRDIQGHGVPVCYFGEPAIMPIGAVQLARNTGAAIVPAISRRLGSDSALITIERRLELIDSGDERADAIRNTERLLQRFEPHIAADPGQWLVLERIWRRMN